MSSLRRPSAIAVVAALLAVFVAGCGAPRVSFDVVRPALVDASPYGNTFAVEPFRGVDPSIAYRVQSMIEQRISSSLNPSIRFVGPYGGGLIVSGDVMRYDYREYVNSRAQTCTRTISVRTARGVESRPQSYPCTVYDRIGTAGVSIRFMVRLTDGRVIYDRTGADERSTTTSATDVMPPGIDPTRLFDPMVNTIVETFARVILPWPDTVTVAFEDCGGDERCGQALELLRAGDLTGAEALYTQILGAYNDASVTIPADRVEVAGETLFNRGIVRAYAGSYEQGMADLQRACTIFPDDERWRAELTRVEGMAAEWDQLRQQIEIGSEAPTGN